MRNGNLLIFIFISVLSVIASSFIVCETLIFNKTVTVQTNKVEFEIPKGSSLVQISAILRQNGFDVGDLEFRFTSRWYGLDSKIRHGRFALSPAGPLSLKELIESLTKGGTITSNVTIPEGLKVRDIAGLLQRSLGIDSAVFVGRTVSPGLLSEFGIQSGSMEGYLYPETYNFNAGDSADQIIRIMLNTTMSKLGTIEDKIRNSNFSLHEILTLASIIQGEVMDYGEIHHISAVYNNRLKKGMLLQADPTIQYLFDKPKRLLNTDIETDDPYNTYRYKGLPPGPINNPSIRSVIAALEPSEAPYIFMVAKGDGTHYFNTSLDGHLEDKAKLDALRRKLRKNQKRGQQ
jgi:UPF0755 protein